MLDGDVAVPRSLRAVADATRYTREEMMAVEAARRLQDGTVCFVGIGLPSLAVNLARRLHAPGCVLVYESGTIGAKPEELPLSIGDGELAETADTVVSVPEMFAYWLQGGRIDVGFLGAAQIDRFGNLNSTVIGDYDAPKVRLPGGGGAPEIATCVRDVFVMLRQNPRAFVERLDFTTSLGERVRVVVTDLGVLEPRDGELTLSPSTRASPPTTRARRRAGSCSVADDLGETEPPTRARAGGAARAEAEGQHVSASTSGRPPGRPAFGPEVQVDYPGYRSTRLRAPDRPLVPLPEELHDLAGPGVRRRRARPVDDDLTRQHDGEPLGERIVVSGRVLDEDGRPVAGALVEVWQANAAGRYRHEVDRHPAPLDPNFSGRAAASPTARAATASRP